MRLASLLYRVLRRLLPGAALLGCVFLATGAQACALDSKPSLSANGVLPILNKVMPVTAAELNAFTPFVFLHPYAAGAKITFEENRADVAQSLVPSAMERPWRWQFGDGTVGYGWSVTHAYAHAGPVSIAVDAYYPGTKQWYQFDLVRLRVVSPAR